MGSNKRKQSLYFPAETLDELRLEAARLDRSLSWIVQKAWQMARRQIAAVPSANDAPEHPRGPEE
jgi:uncharacterized small protein (TIGR04563 family)